MRVCVCVYCVCGVIVVGVDGWEKRAQPGGVGVGVGVGVRVGDGRGKADLRKAERGESGRRGPTKVGGFLRLARHFSFAVTGTKTAIVKARQGCLSVSAQAHQLTNCLRAKGSVCLSVCLVCMGKSDEARPILEVAKQPAMATVLGFSSVAFFALQIDRCLLPFFACLAIYGAYVDEKSFIPSFGPPPASQYLQPNIAGFGSATMVSDG
jgi:hypothetical protein